MILEEKEVIEHGEASYTLTEWLELSSECGALKAALKDCLSALKYIRYAHGDLYGVGWDRAIGNAEKCLGEKDV